LLLLWLPLRRCKKRSVCFNCNRRSIFHTYDWFTIKHISCHFQMVYVDVSGLSINTN
jgi:hypothetical protein